MINRYISLSINFAFQSFISITSILLGLYLLLPSTQKLLEESKNLDSIFIAIGGTLITILILTFSIAIIPIQRAVDSFSKSITYLYRNDKPTYFIFILVSLFSIISFLSAVDSIIFRIKSTLLFPLHIIFVGITLDLIRWYYRRICLLLDPSEAIRRVSKSTTDYINKMHLRIKKVAKKAYSKLPANEKDNTSVNDLETAFYLSLPLHTNFITNPINEITEIGIKAIVKNEIHTAESAINAIVDIGKCYISARKDNILYFPSKDANYLVSDSDISKVMNKVYDNLNTIALYQNNESNQLVCIYALRGFCDLSDILVDQIHSNKIPHSEDLIYQPNYFSGIIIEEMSRKGFIDAVVNGFSFLERAAERIYDKRHIMIIDLNTNQIFCNVIQNYFLLGKGVFINKILEFMFKRLFMLIGNSPYSINELLKDDLRTIEQLFPLALAFEKKLNLNLISLNLSLPYDLSNSMSLPYFIQRATILNKVIVDKPHVNPYHHFLDYNEEICRHFRNLAENYDLGTSGFLHHISESIKHIINIYYKLLTSPITNVSTYTDKLSSDISWYLAFFWVSCKKASEINKYYAIEACDILTWTGLCCYKYEFNPLIRVKNFEIIDTCISSLLSVIVSYTEKGVQKSPYDFADLLLYLWYFRMTASQYKEKKRIEYIDSKVKELAILKHNSKFLIIEAIETRKSQLMERLFESQNRYNHEFNKATDLLKEVIEDKDFFENTLITEVWS